MSDSERGRGDDPAQPRAAAALFALALLAVYHPLLLGRAMLYRDLTTWTVPARAMLRATFARGELPGWNPWESIGYPIPSDPLYATYYPLSLATLPLPTAWGTSVYFFLHVALGGCGLFALARRVGASPSAAAAGALAWSLSGVVSSEWSVGVRLVTMAWIPWVCATAWDLARAARLGRPLAPAALAMALVGGMTLLSGEVYVALMAAIPAAALAVVAARGVEGPVATVRQRVSRGVGAVLAAGIGALLLAAPMLLPVSRLLGTTARRAAMSRTDLELWSMHPLLLGDLLQPDGILHAWLLAGDAQIRALLSENVFYFSVYLGTTAVALAALAPARRAAAAWTALALTALGLLLALGGHTPLLAVFQGLARPFAHMRTPQKFLLLAHTPFALLVALGAERALRGASLRRLALPLLALGAALLAVRTTFSPRVGALYTLGALGALLRLGLVALAVLAARRWGPRAAIALPLVVALDLGWNAWRIFHWVDPSAFEAEPRLAARVRALATTSGRGAAPARLWRSDRVDQGVPGVFVDDSAVATRARLRAKTNLGTGITVLPGYDVGVPPDADRLAESGRIAAVRLLSVDLALLRASAAPQGLRLVAEVGPGLRLFAVESPLPRAYVAHAAVRDAPPPRRTHLLAEPIVTGQTITLPEHQLGALPSDAPRPPSPCVITSWQEGDVTLRCEAATRGVAVLVEQWSPGWSATVDGRPAAVLRANRIMLGVPVDAGAHTVRLRFETPGQRAGLALGALGLLGCAVVAGWLARRRRG